MIWNASGSVFRYTVICRKSRCGNPRKKILRPIEKIVQANEEYLEGKVLDENQELVQQEAQKEQEEKQKEEELQKEKEEKEQEATETAVTPHPVLDLSPERLADYNYLLNNFFIVDPNTATNSWTTKRGEFSGRRFDDEAG